MGRLFHRYFYIDLRSMHLFRAAIALAVLIDIVTRAVDLTAHYTRWGVLSVENLLMYEWNPWYWSLNIYHDEAWFQGLIFGGTALAAISLLFGYRTRLMFLLCWIGIASIQARNPFVLQGGDDLLRLMLFWAMFLPWNIAKPKEGTSPQTSGIATAAIMLQLLLVFQCAVMYKGMQEWWQEGTALYYAYSLDQMVKPLGAALRENYSLTKWLTRGAFILEWSVLPLFLIPVRREFFRLVVFVMLVAFNVVTASTLVLGIFPIVFIASACLLLPSTFWNKIYQSPFTSWISTRNLLVPQSVGKMLPPAVASIVVFTLFTLVVYWNIARLPNSNIVFSQNLRPLLYGLRLDQSWGMFAPTVFKEDGWLILKAKTHAGTEVDLNHPALVLDYNKPANVFSRFGNDRWRKFTEQLYMARKPHLNANYAAFVSDKWHREHPDSNSKLAKLDIVYMVEFSTPYGMPASTRAIVLHEWFDAPASNTIMVNHKLTPEMLQDTIHKTKRPSKMGAGAL